MHKKLEADLISLAHSILQMKNKDNVFLLKQKSKEIYEKLSVLAFVEEYVNSTPGLKETKEELIEKVVVAFEAKENNIIDEPIAEQPIIAEEKVVFNLTDEPLEVVVEDAFIDEIKEIKHQLIDDEETVITETVIETSTEIGVKEEIVFEEEISIEEEEEEEIVFEIIEQPIIELQKEVISNEIIEQPFDELEDIMFSEPVIEETVIEQPIIEQPIINDVIRVEVNKTKTLEEELQDTFSVDLMADLFENAKPKSLNDRFAANIQIGLNDRIAFVKNLFNNEQEDYNRVISQLNTFKSVDEAKDFINKMVKPDYNWANQEELETRFLEIIERKFS